MELLEFLYKITFRNYQTQDNSRVMIFPFAQGITKGSLVKTLQTGQKVEEEFVLKKEGNIILFTIKGKEYVLEVKGKDETGVTAFTLMSGPQVYEYFTMIKK